jgi:hypothetical protein
LIENLFASSGGRHPPPLKELTWTQTPMEVEAIGKYKFFLVSVD